MNSRKTNRRMSKRNIKLKRRRAGGVREERSGKEKARTKSKCGKRIGDKTEEILNAGR